MRQQQAAETAFAADADRYGRFADIHGGAKRIWKHDRRAETVRFHGGDFIGGNVLSIHGDDVFNEGTGLPHGSQIFWRKNRNRNILWHNLADLADGGKRHQRIAKPVGGTDEQATTPVADLDRVRKRLEFLQGW